VEKSRPGCANVRDGLGARLMFEYKSKSLKFFFFWKFFPSCVHRKPSIIEQMGDERPAGAGYAVELKGK
jgi:hypothetical protein